MLQGIPGLKYLLFGGAKLQIIVGSAANTKSTSYILMFLLSSISAISFPFFFFFAIICGHCCTATVGVKPTGGYNTGPQRVLSIAALQLQI